MLQTKKTHHLLREQDDELPVLAMADLTTDNNEKNKKNRENGDDRKGLPGFAARKTMRTWNVSLLFPTTHTSKTLLPPAIL